MLSVEGIDLFYGASHCLRRVSLAAEKGKVTCLLGRNGVGKTSLLRAIIGLEPIKAGRIMWEDRDIAGLAPHARASWRRVCATGPRYLSDADGRRESQDRVRAAVAGRTHHSG